MATFTRTNGNAQTVVSVSNVSVSAETTGVPISFIGKPVRCIAITANASIAAQMGTGEAVETLLRWIGGTNTILAYQVDSTVLSVMMEDGDTSGLTQTNANANLSAASNNFLASAITDLGFKLATS